MLRRRHQQSEISLYGNFLLSALMFLSTSLTVTGLVVRSITTWSFFSSACSPLARSCSSILRKVESSQSCRSANTLGLHCDINMAYSTEERGSLYSQDYRMFFRSPEGHYISPFHDIPLFADQEKKIFNMVVEVPRWTNAKMEIKTTEKLNPIRQDVKKGNVRFVNNVFPHHGYIWNYGALPQTWEDPSHTDLSTQAKGDNDPLDICEIGQKVHPRGSIVQVKILGTFALIDEGETDWKVLAIDVTDPLAEKINDIDDIEKEMTGYLRATHEWFKVYKMPTGKPANEFAFDGEPKNKEFALNIIDETHGYWKELIAGKRSNEIAIENVGVEGSAKQISAEAASSVVQAAPSSNSPQPVPSEVDKTYFLKSCI